MVPVAKRDTNEVRLFLSLHLELHGRRGGTIKSANGGDHKVPVNPVIQKD